MARNSRQSEKLIKDFEKEKSIEEYARQIAPLPASEIKKLPQEKYSTEASEEGYLARLAFLNKHGLETDKIAGKGEFHQAEAYQGNIENFIGMAQVPIGLAGPINIRGTQAMGDFYVPLASSEGALVASYNRGMKACRQSGGITTVCLSEGVQRCPLFKFRSIGEVGLFVKWTQAQQPLFEKIVAETSRYAKLQEMAPTIEGNTVILTFEYTTGEAAGQNMVTICTDQICQYMMKESPVKPQEWCIESNFSGDKKATAVSFGNVRGKKVSAEIRIPKEICENTLKSTPQLIANYWQSSTLAAIQSGSIGAQGHVANGLTALFLACGQDVACISESSIGLTRMQLTESGDLYVAVTLPSLIVGTVGGGTGLPTQKECLKMLGCTGPGSARKFAEICCAVALSGEISIAAAMSANHFTQAHQNLGRKA